LHDRHHDALTGSPGDVRNDSAYRRQQLLTRAATGPCAVSWTAPWLQTVSPAQP